MEENLTTHTSVMIDALPAQVWDGLTNPKMIEKYMMGAHVTSDWNVGDNISWTGEYQGKKYSDRGKIIDVKRNKELVYTHYSPLSGDDDAPENYHTVRIVLDENEKKTRVSIFQDKNKGEKAKEASEKNWQTMLKGLKDAVEAKASKEK